MIKIFFALSLSFFLVNSALAQQLPPRPLEACQTEAPWGFPQANLPTGQSICRMAYALLHDNRAKIPLWTVYTLTPDRAMGCGKRSDSFQADQSLPRGERAELGDYRQSGYDTGHMVNSADMLWSITAERESFILSNMSPQLPNVNRGSWKTLETGIRGWTQQTGDTYTIYSGNIYDLMTAKTIGRNSVVVPRSLWKVVVSHRSGDAWAFLFPNQQGISTDLKTFQITVAELETELGYTIPMPGDKNLKPALLPVRSVSEARQAACLLPQR
jgi:endonuclease G